LDRLETLKDMARLPSPSWQSRPFIRLGIFAVGVLAILAIASVLVPSAKITISPDIANQTITFTAEASRTIETMQLSGVVPAREILVIVEGRAGTETSGQTLISGAAATGSVRLTNLTAVPVTVPEGTIIRTLSGQSVRFATTRSGIVPPDPEQYLTLPVEALSGGGLGNQPAESLLALEGPLGLQLRVTNPLPTLGGTDFQAAAPTNADRQELREELLESLTETAAAEIKAQVSSADLLLSSPKLVEILEETYDPPDHQPAESLNLQLQAAFSAEVAQGQDLEGLANAFLDTSLPEGYRAVEGSLTIRHLTTPLAANPDNARWQIQAQRKITAQMRANQVINLVLGVSPAQANERLVDNLSLSSPPVILLTPAWWPRLPILPFRIQVELEPQRTS
jgi:hypothetical protein